MGSGSSPLTRGKPPEDGSLARALRLIPAHAGKTSSTPSSPKQKRAHPRSRGENVSPGAYEPVAKGSSPLTRGKPDVTGVVRDTKRLIPAHAGKTLHPSEEAPTHEAHPRSRGENMGRASPSCSWRGSSPLTRGKHFPTCAFTAQIDQILETLELAVSSGSYSVWVACATDAPQDQVRSIGLVLPSSRGAS